MRAPSTSAGPRAAGAELEPMEKAGPAPVDFFGPQAASASRAAAKARATRRDFMQGPSRKLLRALPGEPRPRAGLVSTDDRPPNPSSPGLVPGIYEHLGGAECMGGRVVVPRSPTTWRSRDGWPGYDVGSGLKPRQRQLDDVGAAGGEAGATIAEI